MLKFALSFKNLCLPAINSSKIFAGRQRCLNYLLFYYLFFIEILPLSIYRRMFVQADKDLLKQTLDYQVDKVLEETHCEIEDTKEKSESKMRELERSMQVYNDIAMQNVFTISCALYGMCSHELERNMQGVLNHVFRGRFQLFMEGTTPQAT